MTSDNAQRRRSLLPPAHSERMSLFQCEMICFSRALGAELQTTILNAVISHSYPRNGSRTRPVVWGPAVKNQQLPDWAAPTD